MSVIPVDQEMLLLRVVGNLISVVLLCYLVILRRQTSILLLELAVAGSLIVRVGDWGLIAWVSWNPMRDILLTISAWLVALTAVMFIVEYRKEENGLRNKVKSLNGLKDE